jgi:hypothetical protein
MKKILSFYLLLIIFGFRTSDDCGGVLRWDNKILIDPEGLKLFNKKATASSIHSLVNIQRPANSELGKNRSATEKRKVLVIASLIGLGKEGDGDYHLILMSLDKKDSLIAEIPDPSCEKLKHFPGLRDLYEKARKFIEDNVDETPGDIHFLEQHVKLQITGILFFDKMAHGNGHAKNGIEIHPVFKISKAN